VSENRPRMLLLLVLLLSTAGSDPALADHPEAVPEPVIVSVDDVPNDSGGWLRVTWRHSKWDWHPYHDVRSYRVLRQVPGSPPSWEEVGSEMAVAIQTYTATVPALAPNGYTRFMIRAVNLDGTVFWDSAPDSGFALDDISETGDPPRHGFWLDAAFPNPARAAVNIRFSLPAPLHVNLSIYDVAGRLVSRLCDEDMLEGIQRVEWNGQTDAGTEAHPGIYFYNVRTEQGTLVGRVLLMK
jgi:hypothetical protein